MSDHRKPTPLEAIRDQRVRRWVAHMRFRLHDPAADVNRDTGAAQPSWKGAQNAAEARERQKRAENAQQRALYALESVSDAPRERTIVRRPRPTPETEKARAERLAKQRETRTKRSATIRRAARDFVREEEWNHSDPFAFNRAVSHMEDGVYSAVDYRPGGRP